MRFICLVLTCMLFTSSCQATEAKTETPKEYTKWLEGMKKDMVKKGISKKTIEKVYTKDFYHPAPAVVKLDRKQLEFTVTSTAYLNRVINEKRVTLARKKYKELYPKYKDIEEKYGVGLHYLIAFWGVETNFGQTFGNFEVFDALTNLAYDKRRRKFFTKELYQALKIVDAYDIDPEKMEGSWAGAMGHFQFMPSTFNAYAVDYDKDGKIDIWYSFGDALASAANYLHTIGWDKDTEWGYEVSVAWDFDFSHTGRNKKKTIEEWTKLGVRRLNGKKLSLDKNLKGAIIIPEGRRGKVYLVLNNFDKTMMWNRSENYALAIGHLADYIKSDKKYTKFTENPSVIVKTDDVSKIQSFINKLGFKKVDEDGKLGSQTREAIKDLQKRAKIPQDGYPDYQLLNKIDNYNRDIGFAIPVPERKLQKQQ